MSWANSYSEQWCLEKMFIRENNCPGFLFVPRDEKAAGGICWRSAGGTSFWGGPSAAPRLRAAPSVTCQDVPEHSSRAHREGTLSLCRTACREPRVTITANSVASCFPVTLTGISLGCLSSWHKSKLLPHIHMPDLLQSPELTLIKQSQNKHSSSMAPTLHSDADFSHCC